LTLNWDQGIARMGMDQLGIEKGVTRLGPATAGCCAPSTKVARIGDGMSGVIDC
jgi:hypothetical protein